MAKVDAAEISEATNTLVEAASEASAVEGAIEAAQEAQEEAEELAEGLADAAMEAERGRRIETLEGELASWRNEVGNQMSEIKTSLLTLTEKMTAPVLPAAAPPATEAVTVTQEPTAASSIPPVSQVPEVTATTVTVKPTEAPPASEVPIASVKRKRVWL